MTEASSEVVFWRIGRERQGKLAVHAVSVAILAARAMTRHMPVHFTLRFKHGKGILQDSCSMCWMRTRKKNGFLCARSGWK